MGEPPRMAALGVALVTDIDARGDGRLPRVDAASWIPGTLVDVDGGLRAVSPESAGYRALRLEAGAPAGREKVTRFGGRIRR